MNRINLENLTVKFNEGIAGTFPIVPRRYTLTQSALTAETLIAIGREYAYDKINSIGDAVLGEWSLTKDGLRYYIYLQEDGQTAPEIAGMSSDILREELPSILRAVRCSDKGLFEVRPELDRAPITVFFLSDNPIYHAAENWGIFADYNVEVPGITGENTVSATQQFLIDEKSGDVTGDGMEDKVSMYGESTEDSPYISNIWFEITDGDRRSIERITTEISGYNPTLFLGDFTGTGSEDIMISAETGGSGGYGVFEIYTYRDNNPEIIFSSDAYNTAFQYQVDYNDFYTVSIENVALNKLFILDISRMGHDYISQYYNESGELLNPVQGEVLALGVGIPIVGNERNGSFDLLALQRIIGERNSDTLGYIANLMSWDGNKFASKTMVAADLGSDLVPNQGNAAPAE